ncbi:aldo/keto reductase [uncultured Sunxiuqinia sp.]|uniref:aldo/keto reductase n=1 Tax=uncultured Sunxiuqinia sp. TaxID=1573825 RepID=UPI0030D84B84|tara:strand:- start:7941 stop:8870 length:930 start_codon:yes stop_codon:yes gene_type:complete
MNIPGLNRRKFIAALSLGTAHLLFDNPLLASGIPVRSNDPLQVIKLGKSGVESSLIGMGTGVHAGNRTSFLTKQDKNQSIGIIRHAYDRGVRFFDCADTYGTHPLMSEALQKMDRDKITLCSKIWVRPGGIPEPERPDADVVIDRFRKELDTDYLDMVQIHCMVETDWTDTQKRQMEILDKLKAKGIIRAHGVSVHSLDAMKKAVASPWVDIIHVRINPYGIAMDKPEPEEVIEVINQLHESGKGVIGMKLVGNGEYRDDSQKIDHALKFVLGLGSVDMMIVGFETTDQIDNYLTRTENALTALTNDSY